MSFHSLLHSLVARTRQSRQPAESWVRVRLPPSPLWEYGPVMNLAKRVVALVLFFALMTLPVAALAQPRAAPSARFTAYSLSAYEWQDTLWSARPSAYKPDLTVLKQLRVTDLFVDITRAVTYKQLHSSRLISYLTKFRLLVAEAANYGIRVHALMGDFEWATIDPVGISDAMAVLSELRGLRTGRMSAGFQLDVEPWGLPSWSSHEAAYALDYDRMVQRVVSTWRAARFPGSLGFAIPYWWDGIEGAVPDINPGTGRVSPLMAVLLALARVSTAYLNVMTYITKPTSPGGTVAMFDRDLAVEKSIGSRVSLLLGQELAPDPAGIGTTFEGSSWHVWTANVATLRSSFASAPHFGGIAVEDAEALMLLHKG